MDGLEDLFTIVHREMDDIILILRSSSCFDELTRLMVVVNASELTSDCKI